MPNQARIEAIYRYPVKGLSPQRLARSFSHHRELIDALMAHDSAWAKAVMSSHIHSAKQTLLGAQNT